MKWVVAAWVGWGVLLLFGSKIQRAERSDLPDTLEIEPPDERASIPWDQWRARSLETIRRKAEGGQ